MRARLSPGRATRFAWPGLIARRGPAAARRVSRGWRARSPTRLATRRGRRSAAKRADVIADLERRARITRHVRAKPHAQGAARRLDRADPAVELAAGEDDPRAVDAIRTAAGR